MKRRLGIAFVFLFAFGLIATALAQTTGSGDVEILRYVLPGTNTTGMRVHADRSTMNLRLPAGDIWAAGGYKIVLAFAHNGRVVLDTSEVQVPVAGTAGGASPASAGVFYHRTPYAGSVLGVALSSSAALTRGDAHAQVTIYRPATDTVVGTGLRALVSGDGTNGTNRTQVATQNKDVDDPFTATEGIGCQISTASNLLPVTAELLCTVIIEF